MISISNSNLNRFAEEHVMAIHSHLKNSRTKYNYEDINNWFKSNGSRISFEEALLAKVPELIKIRDAYKTSLISDEIKYIRDNLYSSYFAKSSKYLKDTSYNAAMLVKKLGIVVCPYCNRNFINNVTYANRGLKRTSQIDHFHCKEKYPFLAMSFFNLIPSCPSCNHIKSNKDIEYSPYDERYRTSDLMRFDYTIKSMDYIYDENQIEISIKMLDPIIESNAEIFCLESQYKIHKDQVQELIKKKIVYNDTKLMELQNEFSSIFPNMNSMKRTL